MEAFTMAKYLVLYRSSISPQEQLAGSTPEQAQAGMDAWMTWAGKAGEAIVDLGAPLGATGTKGSGGSGGGDYVGGFSILEADSEDALDAVLDGHPHLEQGGTIDYFEFMAVPGME
jgi:hypothetical protein